MEQTAPKMEYYYEEIPMRTVIAVGKELDKRLRKEELELAANCRWGAAYIVVDMKKTGQKFVIARDKKWNQETGKYDFKVQILTEECDKVVSQEEYEEGSVFAMDLTAVRMIRFGRCWQDFEED